MDIAPLNSAAGIQDLAALSSVAGLRPTAPTGELQQAASLGGLDSGPTTVDLSPLGQFLSRITVAQKRFSELQAETTSGPDTDDEAAFARLAAASQNVLDAVNSLQSADLAGDQIRLDALQASSLAERFSQLFGEAPDLTGADQPAAAEQGTLGRVGFNFLSSALAGNVGDVHIDQPTLRAAFQTDRAGTLTILEDAANQLGQIGTQFAPDASRIALATEQGALATDPNRSIVQEQIASAEERAVLGQNPTALSTRQDALTTDPSQPTVREQTVSAENRTALGQTSATLATDPSPSTAPDQSASIDNQAALGQTAPGPTPTEQTALEQAANQQTLIDQAAIGQTAYQQAAVDQAARAQTQANAEAGDLPLGIAPAAPDVTQSTLADMALQELLAENAAATTARDNAAQVEATQARQATVSSENQARLEQDAILTQNNNAAADLDNKVAVAAEQTRVAELAAQSARDRQAVVEAEANQARLDQTSVNAARQQRDNTDAALAQQQAALRLSTAAAEQNRLGTEAADGARSDQQAATARSVEQTREAAAIVLARDQAANATERARDAAIAAQVLASRRLQNDASARASANARDTQRAANELSASRELTRQQTELAAPDARLTGELTTARGNSALVNQIAANGTLPGTTLEQNAATLAAGVNPAPTVSQNLTQTLAQVGTQAAPAGDLVRQDTSTATAPTTPAALPAATNPNIDQGRQLARDPATAAAIAAYHLNESQFPAGAGERQTAPAVKTVPVAPVAAVTRVQAVDPIDGSRAQP